MFGCPLFIKKRRKIAVIVKIITQKEYNLAKNSYLRTRFYGKVFPHNVFSVLTIFIIH